MDKKGFESLAEIYEKCRVVTERVNKEYSAGTSTEAKGRNPDKWASQPKKSKGE